MQIYAELLDPIWCFWTLLDLLDNCKSIGSSPDKVVLLLQPKWLSQNCKPEKNGKSTWKSIQNGVLKEGNTLYCLPQDCILVVIYTIYYIYLFSAYSTILLTKRLQLPNLVNSGAHLQIQMTLKRSHSQTRFGKRTTWFLSQWNYWPQWWWV